MTRMPSAAHSKAKLFVRLSTAERAAPARMVGMEGAARPAPQHKEHVLRVASLAQLSPVWAMPGKPENMSAITLTTAPVELAGATTPWHQ